MTDVTETEHADHPLALINHRQPTDLKFFHMPHGLSEVIVLAATMDLRGHYITCRCLAGVEVVLRQSFADDVAVGHHSDQTIILSIGMEPTS